MSVVNVAPTVRVLAVLSVMMMGCPDERGIRSVDDEQSLITGNGPITGFGGFDHLALKSAVQGDWIVIQGDKRVFEFTILGEDARVMDHRFAQPRTTHGQLLLRSSTSFGVQARDGTQYFFGFVVVDGTTYMGHGGAIALEGDETAFEASLGAWETLVRTEAGCKLVTQFGTRSTEKEVKCDFHLKQPTKRSPSKRVFRYEVPDPFRPDRLKSVELHVMGQYLVEEELARSVASRRGDAPAGNAPEAGEKTAGE